MSKQAKEVLNMTTATSWSITGTYFESCNCEVACPCVFLSAPTDGECTVLIAWHIESGSFGDTEIGGLNVLLAAYAPGLMTEGNWKVALYLDERASESQQAAMTQVFGGQAGGHFEVLGGFIGEILSVSSAAIDYKADGKNRSLTVEGIAAMEVEAIEGADGSEVTISNNPLGAVPGVPVVVAKSRRLTYKDHGMEWEISGKNGYFSPFSYEGP